MSKVVSWLRGILGSSLDTAPLGVNETAPEVEDVSLVDDSPILEPDLTTVPLGTVAPLGNRSQWVYDLGWATHEGLVRDHNEDAIYVNMGYQDADQPVPAFGLFMVSDGMGGHQGGERASMLALRAAASLLIADVYVPLLAGQSRGAEQPSITDVVRMAIQRANTDVTRTYPGSGCTLTFGMTVEERVFIGHVGDSRAYCIKADASVAQLTRDHSFVNRLIEMGELTPEEAELHPQRNVLYRAIGQAGSIDADVTALTMEDGDIILLCSDGLWNMVSELDIADTLLNSSDLQLACQKLVSMANVEGGTDNISLVAFRLRR